MTLILEVRLCLEFEREAQQKLVFVETLPQELWVLSMFKKYSWCFGIQRKLQKSS